MYILSLNLISKMCGFFTQVHNVCLQRTGVTLLPSPVDKPFETSTAKKGPTEPVVSIFL